MLDVLKVADACLFVLSANEEVDEVGQRWLSAIKAQYVPESYHLITHLEAHPAKEQAEIRKSLHSFMQWQWPGEHRCFSVGDQRDRSHVFRLLQTIKVKQVAWRQRHPYFLIDRPSVYNEVDHTLTVEGIVRGRPLSVNQLVHLPGIGDFQMAQLQTNAASSSEGMGESLTPDEEAQEDLQCVNEPDPMDGDQTWPTEEELARGDAMRDNAMQVAPKRRRVPKGTSAYQAAWFLEEDEDVLDEEEEENEEDELDALMTNGLGAFQLEDKPDAAQQQAMAEDSDIDTEVSEEDARDRAAEEDEEDEETRQAALEAYLEEKRERQETDAAFPDEIDVPQNETARSRFAKYRGMKNLERAEWDPQEDLPLDYAKIWEFDDWKQMRRAAERVSVQGVSVGERVSVTLKNVSSEHYDALLRQATPTAWGLLPHEQRMSVANYVMQRPSDGPADVIKSKDEVVIVSGFRRFKARPVYSSHTNAKCHKFERFLAPGSVSVMTAFAPIDYPPAPVLLFTLKGELLATGSLLNVNPSRLVIKRVLLTGIPYKIHKRSAVIRHMFFNREDVEWFKPLQLFTKQGRIGHISEPLGTHGHMKCQFDGPLKQQDTICMALYKRVYPKWLDHSTMYRVDADMIEEMGDMKMEE